MYNDISQILPRRGVEIKKLTLEWILLTTDKSNRLI